MGSSKKMNITAMATFSSKNLATFDYKAYIKCDKYTTKDFDESKVEK